MRKIKMSTTLPVNSNLPVLFPALPEINVAKFSKRLTDCSDSGQLRQTIEEEIAFGLEQADLSGVLETMSRTVSYEKLERLVQEMSAEHGTPFNSVSAWAQ